MPDPASLFLLFYSLSIHPSLFLSVHLSVCLNVCVCLFSKNMIQESRGCFLMQERGYIVTEYKIRSQMRMRYSPLIFQ